MHSTPDATPLKTLTDAAAKAHEALGLKHRPVVIRSDQHAFSIADRTASSVVMLGAGAYWVVCMADAERLERAGYEWAPRR